MASDASVLRADCHVHLALDGADWKAALARHRGEPDRAYLSGLLSAYHSAGIEYLRDGGDPAGVSVLAMKLAPDFGLTVVSPCFPIYKAGHYGAFLGRAWETERDFAALVGEVRRSGGRFIKLMLSGILSFTHYGRITSEPLPPEEIAALVRIAHGEGFPVMAHVNGDSAVRAALEAGVDSVEHGFFMEPETLAQLAASKTVWVPTLSPSGCLIGSGRYPDATLRRILDVQTDAVRRYTALGGLLACGSDAGAVGVPHPFGMSAERRLLSFVSDETLLRGERAIRALFA